MNHHMQKHHDSHPFSYLSLLIVMTCLMTCPDTLRAQRHEILSDRIASLQVVANDDWMGLPIVTLNASDEWLTVSFDDLTHEYHRYTYRLEHCEANWTVSEGLFMSDYLEGFRDGLIIEDCQESLNMATLYTHYTLTLPNDGCRIKMSGNYRLTIIDDNNNGEEMLRAYFMVIEKKMSVSMEMLTNTDIDINNSHQQIAMKLTYNSISVTDPERQLHTVVMQNRRWSTARCDAPWQYTTQDGLQWSHCRQLIFPAGNEYHKFEYLDLHRNSLGIDHTGFDGREYHAWVNTDEPRRNYIYDEDANGAFYIRNTDDYNNDTESEYVQIHFTYAAPRVGGEPRPFDGEVYLNGQFTNDFLLPQYRMEYDAVSGTYQCAVKLKMGYYSYQYLLLDRQGNTMLLPSEGSYYETENQYDALIYYRPIGGRTDLLVGHASIRR